MIVLKNVILNFPNVFKRNVFEGNVLKYDGVFLIAHDSPQHNELSFMISDIIKKKWGNSTPNKLIVTFRDSSENEYVDSNEGDVVFKASSDYKPKVFNKDKSEVSEDERIIVPKCVVDVAIRIWAQDNAYGKKINAELMAIKYVSPPEDSVEIDANVFEYDESSITTEPNNYNFT